MNMKLCMYATTVWVWLNLWKTCSWTRGRRVSIARTHHPSCSPDQVLGIHCSDRSNTGLFILAAFAFRENRVMKIWLVLLLISLAIDDRSRVQSQQHQQSDRPIE